MRRLLVLAALLMMLAAGCVDGTHYEGGPVMSEPGTVSQLLYLPCGHGSDTAIGYNFGKGGGMTVTPVDITIPARYGIVFECTHGSFAIEGKKWVPLWKSLKVGQRVKIDYREIYEVPDALDKQDARRFVKLDFLGATPEGTK